MKVRYVRPGRVFRKDDVGKLEAVEICSFQPQAWREHDPKWWAGRGNVFWRILSRFPGGGEPGLQYAFSRPDYFHFLTFRLQDRDGPPLFHLAGGPVGHSEMSDQDRGEVCFGLRLLESPRLQVVSGTPDSHQKHLDRLMSAVPVPGTLSVSAEEAELYSLLGEPLPYRWSDDRFARWVAERTDLEDTTPRHSW